MKTIAIASDLTARSDRALARGLALAAQQKGKAHALHVVDSELPDALRSHTVEWARGALAREVAACAQAPAGIASCHVVTGKPGEIIAARAHALGADLLVLGTHDTARRGGFATTTAWRIMAASPVPVLLVTQHTNAPYNQVVIGVDFSVHARAALRQALRLAPAAHFTLVHAYTPPFRSSLGTPDYLEAMAYAERLAFDQFLGEEMALLDAQARAIGVAPGALQSELVEGPPGLVLRQACARLSAELLVIGTHGRTGMGRALWGSVATEMLEDPPCDVLVVRPF